MFSPSPIGAVNDIRYAVIGMGIVEEGTPLYFDCGNDTSMICHPR